MKTVRVMQTEKAKKDNTYKGPGSTIKHVNVQKRRRSQSDLQKAWENGHKQGL